MSGEKTRYEAQCPKCGEWSEVEWLSEVPPGGFWWKGEAQSGCPKCGHVCFVESECNFRSVVSRGGKLPMGVETEAAFRKAGHIPATVPSPICSGWKDGKPWD